MRVLQLVDSLETGGTERVAVNIANALTQRIETSFLCATRKEGILKDSIKSDVEYLFLGKQKRIDLKALRRIRSFVKLNEIDIIHAHSSSFFMALLVKLFYNRVKIIWHDHYGNSEFLNKRSVIVLSLTSYFFVHILSVNDALKKWAQTKLNCKNVDYLPNFAIPDNNKPQTELVGTKGKRIVHLANLRFQKDHYTLLRAFYEVNKIYPEWTLHCIGKDFNDDYSLSVKALVRELELQNFVCFYGGKTDISHILNSSNIAVLSSISEGLPIALLEYGFAKLPVVVTNVGDCTKVVESDKNGLVINKEDVSALKQALINLIKDERKRIKFGNSLFQNITETYSVNVVIDRLIKIYKYHL